MAILISGPENQKVRLQEAVRDCSQLALFDLWGGKGLGKKLSNVEQRIGVGVGRLIKVDVKNVLDISI